MIDIKKCNHNKVEEMMWSMGNKHICKECGEPVIKINHKWVSVNKENR